MGTCHLCIKRGKVEGSDPVRGPLSNTHSDLDREVVCGGLQCILWRQVLPQPQRVSTSLFQLVRRRSLAVRSPVPGRRPAVAARSDVDDWNSVAEAGGGPLIERDQQLNRAVAPHQKLVPRRNGRRKKSVDRLRIHEVPVTVQSAVGRGHSRGS